MASRGKDKRGNDGPAPSAPAPSSVGFLLSQLGAISSRRFAKRLEPLDIDPPRFRLLMVISQREGQSQQALGESLQVPASRMVALVDELEERGLVERRAHPGDRRVRALYLTRRGRGLLAKAMERAIEHETGLCSELNEGEREQLIALLRRLVVAEGIPPGVHPGFAGPPGSHWSDEDAGAKAAGGEAAGGKA
jgi:DNA-binding MarR family transcriptional regulator